MKTNFPIKFKYFRIEPGLIPCHTKDALPYPGYVAIDCNETISASGTGLAQLIDYVQKLDIQHEFAIQFVNRHLGSFAHLEGVDIDAPPERPAGLLVPPRGGSDPGMH